jgi:hypothetical protein
MINEFKIELSDIYNMDETGLAIGSMESMESTKSNCRFHSDNSFASKSWSSEWVRIVECICTDRRHGYFLILKGSNIDFR